MENRNISLPFHWSGAVWAMTLVFLLVLVGVGFHLESFGWPTEVLWLKYLLFLVFSGLLFGGVGLYADTSEGRRGKDSCQPLVRRAGDSVERGDQRGSDFEILYRRFDTDVRERWSGRLFRSIQK